MRARISKAILAILSMAAASVAANTINVPSAKYSTIQSAIDAAKNGDTILVSPGTYNEWLVVLKSTSLYRFESDGLEVVAGADSEIDHNAVTCPGNPSVQLSGITSPIEQSCLIAGDVFCYSLYAPYTNDPTSPYYWPSPPPKN